MSIRTKNRRHINVDGKEYIWYVLPEKEGGWHILHICSPDKDMRIRVPLSPDPVYGRIKIPFCYVSSNHNKATQGIFLLPFEVGGQVTPSAVANILKGLTADCFETADYGELKEMNEDLWLFDMIF